ncbi:MAG TPA: Imm26 family immunity protein [Leptospiraceae bacterium]|nr:Imm26 family immunity protein [Leptospiraceae bacterium]HRG74197.1 Imm26 family immunity protein [Leptospiraceae bacterium]
MNTELKKQQRTIGAFIKIPLEKGYHTYARILKATAFAFYDSLTKEDITDLQNIAHSPILFIASVYNDAITNGHWLKIGKLPLETHLLTLPPQYVQDPIQPQNFTIIYDDSTVKIATIDECRNFERFAVWEPHAIEKRINDFYAGRKNKSVEDMHHPEWRIKDKKKQVA